jgi:hypothetical protein
MGTLNLTYQKYILPVIIYSCESLVTAQQHTLQVLERDQNQALRLITGAVKTTPIDVMLFITGNKPIQKLIKEKSVLLHEKLLRIPGDQYWKTCEDKPRNLKTQNGFIQKVTDIKTKLEIKSKPQPLHQRRNPVDIEQVEHHLHLQQNTIKGETETLKTPGPGNNEHQVPPRQVVAHLHRWLANRRIHKRWCWHTL